MAREVAAGLAAPLPTLPSKYFYDARGSMLFERITRLPEYYPTRVEEAIHAAAADDRRARPAASWSSSAPGWARRRGGCSTASPRGTRTWRVRAPRRGRGRLRASLVTLHAAYPRLSARGIVGDFLRDIPRIGPSAGGRMIGFLGGTLGNLDPDRVPAFFAAAASVLVPGDTFLLGVDLVKDAARLEAAYNDSAGVTAEFNRNLLHVVNARLGADFDLAAFQHVAFYDRERDWIEMRLRAPRAHAVHVPAAGVERDFAPGDEIRTEISCKYTRGRLESALRGSGLGIEAWYTDAALDFAVTLLRRNP